MSAEQFSISPVPAYAPPSIGVVRAAVHFVRVLSGREIEPGAVLGGKGEGEAPHGLSGKPGGGLLRDMGGMVVENDLDGGVGRISGVEKLAKFDDNRSATHRLWSR
jgi:hypothetical protein